MSCAKAERTETIPRSPEIPTPNSRIPGSTSFIFVSVSETEVFNSFKKSFVNMMSYGYLENDFVAFLNYDQGQGLFEITFRNRVP